MLYNSNNSGDDMNKKVKINDLRVVFKKFLERFFKIASRPEMRILPGNLAFFLALSFAPIITLLVLVASRFSISLIAIMQDFKNVIPNDIFNILETFLTSSDSYTGPMIIYLLLGFVVASNGAHSIIITSNTLYNVKDDTFLKRRIKAFFLTIILILQFVFILVFLVYGNILMKWILSFEIFDSIRGMIYGSFVFVKWPLMMLVSYILIKLLYALAPDKRIKSKNVTRGALFTTLGWTIITAIYSYYANNLANYNIFYGGLSNLVVLMIWIYIVSYILVMGIAINVSHYENGKGIE
jgi:membrane protein